MRFKKEIYRELILFPVPIEDELLLDVVAIAFGCSRILYN